MIEQRVGIIGWPVTHSLSPALHNAAFDALGMAGWRYELLPTPPDIVRLALREYRDHGYVGINVTVPLKQVVLPHVRPDERATAAGAANTITLRDMRATNTDIAGFMDDLAANGLDIGGRRVIVLGAGGAARAAVYGLVMAGASVAVVNRTPERAEGLIADLGVKADAVSLERAAASGPDLVVNCTSVGMWPNVDDSPWPDDVAYPEGVPVYDMVYRPETTRLMRRAGAAGGRAVGGLGMLVRQGAAAFEIFTGQPAPVDVMFAAARAALAGR